MSALSRAPRRFDFADTLPSAGTSCHRGHFILLAAGIAFSIPAMLAGFFELMKVAEAYPAIKDVNRHMVMIVLSCYTASLFLRLLGSTLMAPDELSIGLGVLGFLFLRAAGWLDGKLVYGHRLGGSPLPQA